MNETPSADAELVARALRGKADAYAELVARYQDQAIATAYFIVGNHAEAEDAAQEAFARAFAALERFRPDGSFRAWLMRIVVNEARDLRTAAQRRSGVLHSGRPVPTIDPPQSAEAAALDVQRRETVLRALLQLREEDRLVITYRYFLDFSEAETAHVLGVARGTIKSRLSRALGRLRPILHDLGPIAIAAPSVGPLGVVLARLRAHVKQQPSVAAAAVGAVACLGVAVALVTGEQPARSAPASASIAAAPARTAVFGGDLTQSDRGALAAASGVDVPPDAQILSRAELLETLRQHGFSAAPDDQAISTAFADCGAARSGVTVRARNLTRLDAPAYAAVLLTVGLPHGAVAVIAPDDKPVTGEAGLVGLLKAIPQCVGGDIAPRRVELAYAQARLISDLNAGSAASGGAGALWLATLQSLSQTPAADDQTVRDMLDGAAAQHTLVLEDAVRNRMLALLREIQSAGLPDFRASRITPEDTHVDINSSQ